MTCLALLLLALPDDASKLLDAADSVELLSLDPSRIDAKAKDQGFHGYKPLGKTVLKGEAKKALLATLRKGIADSDGSVAGCFRPRHGIRALLKGKSVDLVICYECHSILIFAGDKPSSTPTHPGPAKQLNKILADAKVPLPKAPE